jgi:hypothetical protein
VEETNSKLIRILQLLGIFFLITAGLVAIINLVLPIDWRLQDGIMFLSFILICGLSFGIAGLMSENPEKIRKLFVEWLIVIAAILIWMIGVYALL